MIRKKIIAATKEKKYTIYKLSKLSGLGETQLRNYFDAKTDLLGKSIEKLYKVLDLKI